MVEVRLPDSLARLFRDCPRKVTLEADRVDSLIRRLDRDWPGLWDRLCSSQPRIRAHVNVFVDGERATLDTPLRADSVVEIIPAVSGG